MSRTIFNRHDADSYNHGVVVICGADLALHGQDNLVHYNGYQMPYLQLGLMVFSSCNKHGACLSGRHLLSPRLFGCFCIDRPRQHASCKYIAPA